MSRFNRNGVNLKGKKLTEWVEQEPTVTAEETPTEQEDSPPDTGQEPKPAPKPQGKKRNKRSK